MSGGISYIEGLSDATPYKQTSLRRFLEKYAIAERRIIKPRRKLIIDAMAGGGMAFKGKKASLFNILDSFIDGPIAKNVERVLIASEVDMWRYRWLHDAFFRFASQHRRKLTDIDTRLFNGLCEVVAARAFVEQQAVSRVKKLSTLVYIDAFGGAGLEKAEQFRTQHFSGELAFLITFSVQYYNRWRERKGWPPMLKALEETGSRALVCPYSEEDWMGCDYHIGRWLHLFLTKNTKVYNYMRKTGDFFPPENLPEGMEGMQALID